MTVDASYLSAYTNGLYAVSPATGTGETISSTTFTLFYNLALRQFEQDDPGFTDTYLIDEAKCLLICSRIYDSTGKGDYTGEKQGTDYSYTRNTGENGWMQKYRKLMADFKTSKPPRLISIEHSDSEPITEGYNLL